MHTCPRCIRQTHRRRPVCLEQRALGLDELPQDVQDVVSLLAFFPRLSVTRVEAERVLRALPAGGSARRCSAAGVRLTGALLLSLQIPLVWR